MYNCELCNTTSKPGEARRVHLIYREVPVDPGHNLDLPAHKRRLTRKEIAREVAVCEPCGELMGEGDLSGLKRRIYNLGLPVALGVNNRNGQPIQVRRRQG